MDPTSREPDLPAPRDTLEAQLEEERAARRRAEETYRILVEQSLQGLLIAVGMPPRFAYVNAALCDMLGYSANELYAMNPNDLTSLVHPEDAGWVMERLLARATGRELSPSFTCRVLTKDGRQRWFQAFTAPTTFAGRDAIQATFLDVTERMEVDQAFRESEAKFRALVEVTGDIPFTVDTKGVFLYIAPQVERYGFRPDEMVGREFIDFLYPADVAGTARSFQRALEEGRTTRPLFRVPTPALGVRYFEESGEIVRDEAGRVRGLNGILRDVTERMEAERAFRETERKYADLVRNSPDGILRIDPQGIIETANPSMERLTGVAVADMLGKSFVEMGLIAPRSMEGAQVHFEQMLHKQNLRPTEWTIQRPDGTTVVVEANPRLELMDGKVLGILVILRDITERKQAEEDLRRSHDQLKKSQSSLFQAGKMAAVGRLAAGVAHEINNPLAVIGSSAEIVRDLVLSQPESEERSQLLKHLGKVELNVYRCKEIIDNLLDFSRRDVEEKVEADLTEIVRSSLLLLADSTRARRRRVVHLCEPLESLDALSTAPPSQGMEPPPPLPLTTRRREIQQVLLNLLLNAVDATEEKGLVAVGAGRDGGDVVLTVADDGTGMDPQVRERVFEPFFTTKEVGQGTGLGLYLSHQIVETLGGSLAVTSEPGVGTIMRLVLPAGPDPSSEEGGP